MEKVRGKKSLRAVWKVWEKHYRLDGGAGPKAHTSAEAERPCEWAEHRGKGFQGMLEPQHRQRVVNMI